MAIQQKLRERRRQWDDSLRRSARCLQARVVEEQSIPLLSWHAKQTRTIPGRTYPLRDPAARRSLCLHPLGWHTGEQWLCKLQPGPRHGRHACHIQRHAANPVHVAADRGRKIRSRRSRTEITCLAVIIRVHRDHVPGLDRAGSVWRAQERSRRAGRRDSHRICACLTSTFICWAPQVSAIVSFDQRSNVMLTVAPILCRPCSRIVPGAPLSTTCSLVPELRVKPLSQPRSTHGAGGVSGSNDATVVASNIVGVAVIRFTGAKYPRTRRTAGGKLGCITNAGVLIALLPPRSSQR